MRIWDGTLTVSDLKRVVQSCETGLGLQAKLTFVVDHEQAIVLGHHCRSGSGVAS